MKFAAKPFTVTIFLCLLSQQVFSQANNPVYENRRQDFIDTCLQHFSSDALNLQAYRGLPLDTPALMSLLSTLQTKSTVDFDIVKLVRILFLTNGAYDSMILPPLLQLPFWLTKGDTLRGYWSENHMIQWMSSDWLLHERYNKPVDTSLHNRIMHYLDLKVKYGYYEFNSSTYAPYALSGLLNLTDFAQDTVMKNMAAKASQRLLSDLLLMTNDKGVYFPVAGRNYYGKYETPYGQNHNNLIYLLTGMGQMPLSVSHGGSFLATSALFTDSVAASWISETDTVFHIGHPVDSAASIHAGQSPLDYTIFHWSSGMYFHPVIVENTANLLTDSMLWHHVDFAAFAAFESLPISSIVLLANNLSVASKSSAICGEELHVFKHGSITLGSIHDFWKGKLGYQQFPVVANVGTTAVLTASGKINPVWSDRLPTNANEHLPMVEQKKNVALVMYRPEPKPEILGYRNPEVALFFRDQEYDEVVEDSLWLLGRQGTNYVAVRRYCLGEIDSVRACDMSRGQTWVIIVGDSGMYQNFSAFGQLVHQSVVTENWYIDSTQSKSVYYASISFDTSFVEYAWMNDTTLSTGMESLSFTRDGLTVYPNPASDRLTIQLEQEKSGLLYVVDYLGRKVFEIKLSGNKQPIHVDVSGWQNGVYSVVADDGTTKALTRFVKY